MTTAPTPPSPTTATASPAAGVDVVFLTWLRRLSIVEGVSTLLLFFVAMPLKYFADMPMAVTIVGSIHGLLFTALVVMFAVAHAKVPLPGKLALLGLVAAVFPFGPFLIDGKLKRVGEV